MLQILSVRRGREVPRYDLYGRQHTWAPFCFPNVFQERCSKRLQGFPSVFQTSQPDFPDSKRLFPAEKSQNFKKDPWTSVKNSKKTLGRPIGQPNRLFLIYTGGQVKRYPLNSWFTFLSVQPKPLKLGSMLIPHFKALICGYLLVKRSKG